MGQIVLFRVMSLNVSSPDLFTRVGPLSRALSATLTRFGGSCSSIHCSSSASEGIIRDNVAEHVCGGNGRTLDARSWQ